MTFNAIDLFSGIGGLTEGLKKAGFGVKVALEIDKTASDAYKMNHHQTSMLVEDIRLISKDDIERITGKNRVHLLAGCPPCQGFSSIRRLNRLKPVDDKRNDLIREFVRFVKELKPHTFMMENVPGLILSESFKESVDFMKNELKYYLDYDIINVKNYGVPQNRKRLVMLGSCLGPINIDREKKRSFTVKEAIGNLPLPEESSDPLHKMYPKHTERIQAMIRDIPHNGGSRIDLGPDRQLKCHTVENRGFHDVYGRLRWDYSSTITGGCLNPSKGRFLHPEQDRCITAREAALLQSFPKNYKFPTNCSKDSIALMIGNALPPRFSYYMAKTIKRHLEEYLDRQIQ
jgi:DNA (cytosine-5)-methyltransferase 1